MKTVSEFRERLKSDPELKKRFESIKDADEAIKIAKENGYDLSNCSKQEEEQLTEDMLESVAGGKKKNCTTITETTHMPDNVIKVVDPNDPSKFTLVKIDG